MSIDPGFDLSPDWMIGPTAPIDPGFNAPPGVRGPSRGRGPALGPRGPRGARGPLKPVRTPTGIKGPTAKIAPKGANLKFAGGKPRPMPKGIKGPKVPAKGRIIDVAKKPAAGGGLFNAAGKSIAAAGKLPASSGAGSSASTGGFDLNSILSQLGLGGGALNSLLSKMGGTPISIADKFGNPTQIGQLINQANTPFDLSTADTMAQHEFGPLISATQAQQKVQVAQAAQNQADIQNWYAQVVGAANQAIAGDAAISKGAAQSDQNIAASLASSIGGSANPASANVAAAGENNAAFSNAITSSQAQYDNQIPGLLKADQSATSMREQGLQQQQALALATQLASQQGQEAQAADQLRMQMQQQNQQMAANKLQELLGIKQYNSGLASGKAQNTLNTKLALAQMAEAAPSLGLKSALTQAQIAHELGVTPGQQAAQQHQAYTDKLNYAKYLQTAGMNAARMKLIGLQGAKIVNGILTAKSGGKPVKVNLSAIGNSVAAKLGVGADFKIPKSTWASGRAGQTVATTIGSYLQSAGLTKGSPEYRRLAAELYTAFKSPSGQPLRPGANWWK